MVSEKRRVGLNYRLLYLTLVLLVLFSFQASALSGVTLSTPLSDSVISGNITLNATTNGNATNATFDFINSSGDIVITEINDTNGTLFLKNFDTTNLSDGIYTVNVTAVNGSGNTTINQSTNVTIDNTLPDVMLNAPADNINTTNSVNFNWTATDSLDTILACNLTIDGAINQTNIASTNNTATNQSLTGFADGGHNWNITCFDNAGNSNTSATRSFTTDSTLPSVLNISLNDSDNITTSSQLFHFNVTVTDATTSVTQVNISNSSIVTLTQNGSLFSTDTNASSLGCGSDGNCLITITAIDQVGNVNNTQTFTLTVDSTSPSVDNLTLNDTILRNDSNFQINVTINDANILNVTIGNSTQVAMTNMSATAYQLNTTPGALGCAIGGNCTLTVAATDAVNNINNTVTTQITVENTAPGVLLNSPANDSNTTSTSINFNWTAIDGFDSSLSCDLTIDSTVNQSLVASANNTPTNATVSSLAEGNHTWNITCFDDAGNSNASETRIFLIIDTTIPGISSIIATPSATSAIINWTTSEATNSTVDYGNTTNLTLNAANSSFAVNHTATLSSLSEDTLYFYNITTCDATGNCNITGPFNFTTLETTSPVINITSPLDNQNFTTTNITVNWTIIDNNPNTTTMNFDFGTQINTSAFLNNTANTVDLTNALAGRHTITINATDDTGNTASSTITFTTFADLNATNFTQGLNGLSEISNSQLVDANNNSINHTGNQSLNITNNQLTLTFDTLASGNNVSVSLVNFTGTDANYNTIMNLTTTDSQTNTTIRSLGSTPVAMITLDNASSFLANNAYTGKTFINTSNINYTYVYYCENSSQSCSQASQCTNNNQSSFDGNTACYVNQTGNTTVLTPHFSSIVLSLDNIVGALNITSPDNSSPLVTGSRVLLTFSANEAVTVNMSLLHNGNIMANFTVLGTLQTSFNSTLLGNLTQNVLPNGNYTVVLNLTDSLNNTDTINYTFVVNDTAGPSLSSSSVSNIDEAGADISVSTNEYANITVLYGTSATDLSSSTTQNSFTLTPQVSLTGLNEDTTYFYNVSGIDVLGQAASIGTFSFTTDDESSSSGGGGGGGGGSGGGYIPNNPNLTSAGREVSLSTFGKYDFALSNGEKHTIRVKEIKQASATFEITSEPVRLVLQLGEAKNIDIDDDGKRDVYVKLMSIGITTARILIGKPKTVSLQDNPPEANDTIQPEMQPPSIPEQEPQEQEPEIEKPAPVPEETKKSNAWIWAILLLVLVAAGTGSWIKLESVKQSKNDEDALEKADAYIQNMHSIGKTNDEIRTTLLNSGWDPQDIEKEISKIEVKEAEEIQNMPDDIYDRDPDYMEYQENTDDISGDESHEILGQDSEEFEEKPGKQFDLPDIDDDELENLRERIRKLKKE